MTTKRALAQDEIDLLLSSCRGPDGLGRLAAISHRLAGSRSAELASLRRSDIERDRSNETASRIVVDVGSRHGPKHRRLEITGEAASDIAAYLLAEGGEFPFDSDERAPDEIPFRSFRLSAASRLLHGHRMPPGDPARIP